MVSKKYCNYLYGNDVQCLGNKVDKLIKGFNSLNLTEHAIEVQRRYRLICTMTTYHINYVFDHESNNPNHEFIGYITEKYNHYIQPYDNLYKSSLVLQPYTPPDKDDSLDDDVRKMMLKRQHDKLIKKELKL